MERLVPWWPSRDGVKWRRVQAVQVEIEIEDNLLQPQDTKLHEALTRLEVELNLPHSVPDMAAEIKRTAVGIQSLWVSNAWADAKLWGNLLQPFIEETKNALRDHAHLKSAREERQLAKSIWSARQNRRGRNHEINPGLLLAILESVERIAGQTLSYSRKRTRNAQLGAPTSGPPEGAMLDVLMAALDWAYAFPTPQRKFAPLKREGVLSAIKRLRRSQGQN
jgi:hypothetical protein